MSIKFNILVTPARHKFLNFLLKIDFQIFSGKNKFVFENYLKAAEIISFGTGKTGGKI